jgi:hypothetical protein
MDPQLNDLRLEGIKLEQVRASSFRPHPDSCAVKRLIKTQYAAALPRLYDYVFLSRHSHHHTGDSPAKA